MRVNEPTRWPKLAIMDWGIGGLTFFKLFKEVLPAIPVVYFSDSGERPYGKQVRSDLEKRLVNIAHFLSNHGVTMLVVACNAMSSVLSEKLRSRIPAHFDLVGVIDPTVDYLRSQKGVRRVGVVGGTYTVRSGVYRKPFIGSGIMVRQKITQPLSALIEAGDLNSPQLCKIMASILQCLKDVDCLVLACTHYTAIAERFQALLPGIEMVDPCKKTLNHVLQGTIPVGGGQDLFLTTGDSIKSRAAAKKVFGLKTATFRPVVVDHVKIG
ncbi:MAG: aspartate/glutamate racemase family protein [Bacteroidetes bacterium]|nr:aspartate/glutamate racemase family protein [Bacteroidota bacterium]